MEDYVPFNLAKKLKEKGFSCEYPFAIYDEDGEFFTLYSSDKYYFEIENFDDRDFIAPTISQVLKWLREEKELHICISLGEFSDWVYDISKIEGNVFCKAMDDFHSYEEAALAGVNYCLENLI